MADIIKNDCQGENEFPVNYETRDAMLALRGKLSKRATSSEFNEWSAREVCEYIDVLKAELEEAREIIKSFHLEYVDYSVINNLSGHNNHNPRWARRFLGMKEELSLEDARAFLKENENV